MFFLKTRPIHLLNLRYSLRIFYHTDHVVNIGSPVDTGDAEYLVIKCINYRSHKKYIDERNMTSQVMC